MAYTHTNNSGQNALTLMAVAALHGAVGYVFIAGLEPDKIIPQITTILEATNIKAEPPAPPVVKRLSSASAKAMNDPSTWITKSDYSSRAIREGQEGTIRLKLTISTEGRVAACKITGSSGHPELDATTCRLVTKRAQFEPARNKKGENIEGSYKTALRWRIKN